MRRVEKSHKRMPLGSYGGMNQKMCSIMHVSLYEPEYGGFKFILQYSPRGVGL